MSIEASLILAAVGILFTGLSKAGFGGGLGMITTPLCAVAFGPKAAVGIVLPLLCVADAFSLYHYWKQWDRRNLWYVLPGAILGVVIGTLVLDQIRPLHLNLIIGITALLFVGFQTIKNQLFAKSAKHEPNYYWGTSFGLGAGITSALANGAGPVIAMYLVPQQLPKKLFVGTNTLIFTWINWIKVGFFLKADLINASTLKTSALYLPLIPIGVWIGVWLNRRVSEERFVSLTYFFILLAGVYLVGTSLFGG